MNELLLRVQVILHLIHVAGETTRGIHFRFLAGHRGTLLCVFSRLSGLYNGRLTAQLAHGLDVLGDLA